MSEPAPRLSLLQRLLNKALASPSPNGNAPAVQKKSGVALVDGISYNEFGEPDGSRTVIQLVGRTSSEAERVDAQTAYAASCYAYAAMRWRASSLAEPPLMVVNQDQRDSSEKWLPNHPLADLLDAPSLDYDMGELLFRTSLSIDAGGSALWIKDLNRAGTVGRLQLFRSTEFSIESTRDRLRGLFRLSNPAVGSRTTFSPDEVVYFVEPDPLSWTKGLSKLETFLGWLNLSQVARAAVRDLLTNSSTPSLIVLPDKDWRPSPEDREIFRDDLASYSEPGNRGKAYFMEGGGTVQVLAAKLRDLIPGDILDRVESICASVFGVPAIILQFQVGMENAPWSQMQEARRMATEDTAVPRWNDVSKVLTRQLLRPIDENTAHLVRFDTSKIKALQTDLAKNATIVVQISRIASLNERRAMMGLDPIDDPDADEIPELQPPPIPLMGGLAAPGDDEDPPPDAAKRVRARLESKRDLWAQLRADEVARGIFQWQLGADKLLKEDRDAITRLAAELLEDGKAAGDPPVPTPGSRRRFTLAVSKYLDGQARKRWGDVIGPMVAKDAARSTRAVAADLGINFATVRPELAKFAEREVGWLIKNVHRTTRDAVADAVRDGVAEGIGARGIAERLKGLPEFGQDRALLVARTEATRVTQGAPTEALAERGAALGLKLTKTWRGVLDERERDEHVAMEGETVAIDEVFSNGLPFPSEPNCRCVLTYGEVKE